MFVYKKKIKINKVNKKSIKLILLEKNYYNNN
jgi:hypothetical protein